MAVPARITRQPLMKLRQNDGREITQKGLNKYLSFK